MNAISAKSRKRIGEVWLERTLRAYSPEYARFVMGNQDPFANPVAGILRDGLSELFEALLDDADLERCRRALDPIVRLKAVQEAPPSEALAFVPMLKEIVREEFGKQTENDEARCALLDLDARIDNVVLLAFDLYSECREKIFQIRVNELKRNTAGLVRRGGRLQPGPDQADEASCSATCQSDEGCCP